MYIETQLMDQFFAGVCKWCIVCVSLVASHIICGQTNYYITVSQPVGNQVANKWFVTLVAAFDPPMHHDTNMNKLHIGRVYNTHMPFTNTLCKGMMWLPLTVKCINNISALKGTLCLIDMLL